MADEIKVLRTPYAILSYPHLFQAFASEDDLKLGRKPKYSCALLFDAEAQKTAEWAALRAEANRVAAVRFGDKLPGMVTAGDFKSPFLDGNKYAEKNPECAGKIMLRVSTLTRPGIVDANKLPVTDETKAYPGVIVRASLNAYAYPQVGKTGPAAANKGVSFGLRNIQIVMDGTPLGSRTRAEDDFDVVEVAESKAGGMSSPEALF